MMTFLEISIVSILLCKSIAAEFLINRNGLEIAYNSTFVQNRECLSEVARFQIYERSTLEDCVQECSLRGHCAVSQYKIGVQSCELYTAQTEDTVTTECVIVRRNDITIKHLPCADGCQYGMTCDLDSRQCLYKECVGSPTVQHGAILGNRKELGSKLRLKCHQDFAVEVNERRTTVCRSDGSWSSLPATCKQTTFQCPESDMAYTHVLFVDGTSFIYRVVHEQKLTHAESFVFCQSEGAKLIQTFPEQKRNVLFSLMRKCSTRYQRRYWIDGNNKNADDFNDLTQWVTSADEPLVGDFWGYGEPSNPTNDHCAYLYMENPYDNKLMSDWDCDDQYFFICEKDV